MTTHRGTGRLVQSLPHHAAIRRDAEPPLERNRPLLQTADPRARLHELHEQRDPLYRDVAHLIVDTGSQSVKTLIARLELQLAERQPGTEQGAAC